MEPRITRLLDRRGLGDGDDDGSVSDTWAGEAPVLAGLAAASVQGTVALGVRPVFVSDGPHVGVPEVCLWRTAARRPRPSRLTRRRPAVTIGA